MIINIRGTSGSGKSTIVREAMRGHASNQPVYEKGRRQPLGYWLGPDERRWQLAVLGHYETACGGCDTLPGYDIIFDLVRAASIDAEHVLFEGILVSEEVRRTQLLHNDYPSLVHQPLLIIQLTTPIDVCLDSIRARREARGDTRELRPDNTVNRVRTIEKSCERLREAGVVVEQHTRESGVTRVKEIINDKS